MQQQQQQHNHHQSSNEFVKALSEFFKRDLISIPLIKSFPHLQVSQRCGLKAATLELDTASHPHIEYIAGDRLSVYPVNPVDQVEAIMKHVDDDVGQVGKSLSAISMKSTTPQSPKSSPKSPASQPTQPKSGEPWSRFLRSQPRDKALKMALMHLFDIMTAPSRDLLCVLADCTNNKDHKSKLMSICKSDDTWERWVCQSRRTLRSTLDEFSSCRISAKRLFSELPAQQPRQYSLSNIKSINRCRTEICVFEHRFDVRKIAAQLQDSKERIRLHQADEINHVGPSNHHASIKSNVSTQTSAGPQAAPTSQNLTSFRSIRSMVPSPISTHQVERVPTFSGPVTSMYALHTTSSHKSLVLPAASPAKQQGSANNISGGSKDSKSLSSSSLPSYVGLCSHYLLSLKKDEHIICEFVENPRFTLKGNRERPIMMIGQDVGLIAFRPFWQQRVLEHDRAQVFYTMFKDLKQKKFGDMQLVCLTGHKARVEELYKREISSIITHKIISSVTYLNKSHLMSLLEKPLADSYSSNDKEAIALGHRMAKLLIEQNGCLYTCCDSHMTQALEILLVESIARLHPKESSLTKDVVMTSVLPKWKGRKLPLQKHDTSNMDKADRSSSFLFTLENSFERAHIVQEIYHSSI